MATADMKLPGTQEKSLLSDLVRRVRNVVTPYRYRPPRKTYQWRLAVIGFDLTPSAAADRQAVIEWVQLAMPAYSVYLFLPEGPSAADESDMVQRFQPSDDGWKELAALQSCRVLPRQTKWASGDFEPDAAALLSHFLKGGRFDAVIVVPTGRKLSDDLTILVPLLHAHHGTYQA